MTYLPKMGRAGLSLLALAAISACAAPNAGPINPGVSTVNVPIVTRDVMTYELTTPSGNGFAADQRRELGEWLDSIGVGYGDRISVDQATARGASTRRVQVELLLRQRGLILEENGPVTAPALAPGATRIVVVRAHADVPDCPNHSSADDLTSHGNSTSSNYGCGINSAIAQMIADPNDLLGGRTHGGASADRAVKAIGRLPIK